MPERVMNEMTNIKAGLERFNRKLSNYNPTLSDSMDFEALVMKEMREVGFEEVNIDKAGNIVGIIRKTEVCGNEDVALLTHMDLTEEISTAAKQDFVPELPEYKRGIVTGIYAGALLRNSKAKRNGNLAFSVVKRNDSGENCADYLFQKTFQEMGLKISKVLLSEPTGLNLNLGHKGKMEYEIRIKGDFVADAKESRIGLTFPLISELGKVSETLPSDPRLGRSNLSVSGVNYMKFIPGEPKDGVRLSVDRVYIPAEDQLAILSRAKSIAEKVYDKHGFVSVATNVALGTLRAQSGFEMVLEKNSVPWNIGQSDHYVVSSLAALKKAGINAVTGYWKKLYTLGSYTFGKLKIPTVGFGAGEETGLPLEDFSDLEKAIRGTLAILEEQIAKQE